MHKIFVILLLFSSSFSIAQHKKDLTMFSIGGGTILPISPTRNSKSADYIGLNNFKIDIYRLFNDKIGVGASYSYSYFEAGQPLTSYLKCHKFGVNGIFNLGEKINIIKNSYNFKLYTYAGVSLTVLFHENGAIRVNETVIDWGSNISKKNGNYERAGSIDIGISPSYKISDWVSLKFDLTYSKNLKVEYGYDGYWEDRDVKNKTSSHLSLNIGLNIFIKNNRKYSKWI